MSKSEEFRLNVQQNSKEERRLREEIAQLRDEIDHLNVDLTEKELQLNRVITVMEKHVQMLDKLLDKLYNGSR